MTAKSPELVQAHAQARRIMDTLRGEFNLKNPNYDRLFTLADNLCRVIVLSKLIGTGAAFMLDTGIAKQQAKATSGASMATTTEGGTHAQ